MTSKINNIPSKITYTPIDDLSTIIKNISKYSCNIDYINDMFNYFSIDNATIYDVKFINGIAIINCNSKYSRDRYLDLKFDDKYDKLFIFQSLSLDTRKFGLLYYHSIKSGSIKSLKSVFNKITNLYEELSMISLTGYLINIRMEDIFCSFFQFKIETDSNKKLLYMLSDVISISLINIRSLLSNIVLLLAYLKIKPIYIIGITHTWISIDDTDIFSLCCDAGYNLYLQWSCTKMTPWGRVDILIYIDLPTPSIFSFTFSYSNLLF